mmetsp:Transcript_25028/g.51700  ORF Transcript_25028/g.51700 Transcript_25028/m.51700 type:complete len:265 (-) Transcript_25028:401-1195(-)
MVPRDCSARTALRRQERRSFSRTKSKAGSRRLSARLRGRGSSLEVEFEFGILFEFEFEIVFGSVSSSSWSFGISSPPLPLPLPRTSRMPKGRSFNTLRTSHVPSGVRYPTSLTYDPQASKSRRRLTCEARRRLCRRSAVFAAFASTSSSSSSPSSFSESDLKNGSHAVLQIPTPISLPTAPLPGSVCLPPSRASLSSEEPEDGRRFPRESRASYKSTGGRNPADTRGARCRAVDIPAAPPPTMAIRRDGDGDGGGCASEGAVAP